MVDMVDIAAAAAATADDDDDDDDEGVVAEVVAVTCGMCKVNPS